MPRLSIIVPHRHQDSRLEATLLSVLENRPVDSEIIVVHDGSYADPYHLDDEVILIEEEPLCNTLQLLNAGVMAACSPAICVLVDGTTVSDGWSEFPLAALLGSDNASVAVSINSPFSSTSRGIDARLLTRPSLSQAGKLEAAGTRSQCIGPVLACGFYRRKVLLAVGGWNEELDEQIADVALALALNALGLACQHIDTADTVINSTPPRKLSISAWRQLASVVAAHGIVAPGWGNSLKSLLGGCLQGRMFAAAAWSAGLRDANSIRRTQLRMNHARQQFSGDPSQQSLRVYRDNHQPSARSLRRQAA